MKTIHDRHYKMQKTNFFTGLWLFRRSTITDFVFVTNLISNQIHIFTMCRNKQAEKLKSCEIKRWWKLLSS